MKVSSYLVAKSSCAASSPIASKSPGMPIASGKPDSRMSVEPSLFDAASASQVRLKDAYLGGLKEEQQGNLTHEKEQISEETDDSESVQACQEKQQNPSLEHFFAISPQTISYTEAVHDTVRKIYGRPSDDPMEDLDVNVAIWRVLMNATLKAAIHLGNDHDVNLRHVKNSFRTST